ncbi:hypothetical protein K8S19_12860 [bacterium]|nr:hypothetical protein [bacterium]
MFLRNLFKKKRRAPAYLIMLLQKNNVSMERNARTVVREQVPQDSRQEFITPIYIYTKENSFN